MDLASALHLPHGFGAGPWCLSWGVYNPTQGTLLCCGLRYGDRAMDDESRLGHFSPLAPLRLLRPSKGRGGGWRGCSGGFSHRRFSQGSIYTSSIFQSHREKLARIS